MSTTVRVVATVEVTVAAWNEKETFEHLGQTAVREAKQILANAGARTSKQLRVISVDQVKFVTHDIDWIGDENGIGVNKP